MKILLISWVLLVVGVTLNSGHYIYKVEKENAPSYEVQSNPKGLVLVKTKYERPSLKDILYPELYERFYGKEEHLITERAFTNSHGLPFLGEFENDNIPQNGLEETDDGLFEEPKPLTDEAVKTAYKSKSYLFDQMRQRSDVPSEDFIERKKRWAEIPYFPDAQQVSGLEPFALPNTYGMNLNPNGGYVWNNLNNPPSLYEVEQPSNGNENTSQNPPETSETPAIASSAPEETPAATSSASEETPVATSSATEETTAATSSASEETPVATSSVSEETPVATSSASDETLAATSSASEEAPAITSAAPENLNSGSSEDIYVNINRPTPANEGKQEQNQPKEIPVENNENQAPNDNSDTSEPKPLTESAASEANNEDPKGKAIEIPESPKETVSELNSQEVKPEPAPVNEDAVELKTAAESSSVVPDESAASSGEAAGNPEGDQAKEIPEAPTLPPLNYDGLPDYIREAISTTEREYKQTDNPFLNPQPSSEDKEMEGIMATAQPVENIPRTYGMNLTSGSGKVWNDLVNPPVSYEVGSTESNQSEEPKETTLAPAIVEEPVIAQQPENPAEEPEKDKEPANREENITPIDIQVVTEQPENVTNEPDLILPGTENKEESKPTELPEATTEIPVISDSTESDIKPETENPETKAPIIEPVTEEIKPVTDLPEILSTTEEREVSEDNKQNDDIEPLEPVTAVTPAEEPEVDEPESESGETGDEAAQPEEKPNDVDEKRDIMSELLKSEQFWKWLGELMAAYTELMEKHIRKIAIQEICNARHVVDICPLDKPADSGSIIKDGKVTIDGKEIDLNGNLNQLKRGNKGHSVDATTIYGNSVGNDKVTNVFIFNPNNAKDILEGIKPENNSNVNIIIEEKKEEDKGRSDEEVTAVPEIEENKEITEDAGIEDRKDGEAGVEVAKEDIEEATEKQVKAISNSGESKDDIKSEVEKVTEAVELKGENLEDADVK